MLKNFDEVIIPNFGSFLRGGKVRRRKTRKTRKSNSKNRRTRRRHR